LAAVLAGTQTARAEEPPPPADQQASWYGWQTLLTDAGAIGLWVVAGLLDDAKYASSSQRSYQSASKAALLLGVGTYVLAAPAVHVAHGHRDRALTSLGLRVGLPIASFFLAGFVGSATCRGSDADVPCPFVYAMLGGLGGGAAAMVVDAAVLGHEARAPSAVARFQTGLVPTTGGGMAFLAGRF
jgi:hypothetical protein